MAATMNKIGSLIAKGFGIRLCADAEAVQNNQKTRFSILPPEVV